MLNRINRNRINRDQIKQKHKDEKESEYIFNSKNKASISIISYIKLLKYK